MRLHKILTFTTLYPIVTVNKKEIILCNCVMVEVAPLEKKTCQKFTDISKMKDDQIYFIAIK